MNFFNYFLIKGQIKDFKVLLATLYDRNVDRNFAKNVNHASGAFGECFSSMLWIFRQNSNAKSHSSFRSICFHSEPQTKLRRSNCRAVIRGLWLSVRWAQKGRASPIRLSFFSFHAPVTSGKLSGLFIRCKIEICLKSITDMFTRQFCFYLPLYIDPSVATERSMLQG